MNWKTDVEFCPDMGRLTTDKMAEMLAKEVFSADSFASVLKARYMQMKDLFRDVPFDDARWNLTVDETVFNNVVEAVRPKGMHG